MLSDRPLTREECAVLKALRERPGDRTTEAIAAAVETTNPVAHVLGRLRDRNISLVHEDRDESLGTEVWFLTDAAEEAIERDC